MNVRFPDATTVRTVLALASRAPSVHNTQPWRWRVDEAALHLYSDAGRQLPNTDPEGRDLILSCGAALNHCVIALAAHGWRAKVTRFPDPAEPGHLASIEVAGYHADSLDIALAAAIPRRRTDRRHYSSWPVPVGDIALMAARAARNRRDTMSGRRYRQAAQDCVPIHLGSFDSRLSCRTHRVEWALRVGRGRSGAAACRYRIPTAKIPGRLFAGPALAMPPGSSPAEDNAVVLAWEPGRTTGWLSYAPVRPPAWCCSPRRRWDWRVARSPSRSRSPKRERRFTPTSSAAATIRRCCFGWGGRRSMPTHYRPHRGANSPSWSSGAGIKGRTAEHVGPFGPFAAGESSIA